MVDKRPNVKRENAQETMSYQYIRVISQEIGNVADDYNKENLNFIT